MNQQETCEDDIKTQSLKDLTVPAEQSEDSKPGQTFNSFGGFSGGATIAGQRF